MEPADDCTFLYGNCHENREFGAGFLVHNGIIPAVKKLSSLQIRRHIKY
jgi:hypothetical protein